MGQVESHFGPFGDSVNLDTRWVYGLRRMYHGHGNVFWLHLMELLGDVDEVDDRFGLLSFWAYRMELLGNVGQVKAHFGPFGDSVNRYTRLVHNLRRTCNRLKNRFGHAGWNS
jgi:hypothetical protein